MGDVIHIGRNLDEEDRACRVLVLMQLRLKGADYQEWRDGTGVTIWPGGVGNSFCQTMFWNQAYRRLFGREYGS